MYSTRAVSQSSRKRLQLCESQISGKYGSGLIWKFACPNRSAHGSLSSEIASAGISDDGWSAWLARALLNDAIEALVDSGGVGKPGITGVLVGVFAIDAARLGAAIVGDCKGD